MTGSSVNYTTTLRSFSDAGFIFLPPKGLGALWEGYYYTSPAKHYIHASLRNTVDSAAFTPKQAHTVDKKLDDGMPTTGIITFRNAGGTMVNTCTDNGATKKYLLTSDAVTCNIMIAYD